MTESHPRRWQIWVVDLEPRIRSKPGKQRPCLLVQPSEFGEGGLVSSVVIPLTTRLHGDEAFPLRVRVPKGTCGLREESELMIDQILAWDHSLFRENLGEIAEGLQDRVREALREFLDL